MPRRPSLLCRLTPLALLALAGCFTVPITGTKSFIPLSASQDVPLGAAAYEEILAEANVISSGATAAMVQRVVDRLVEVVERDGLEPSGVDFDWEVSLVDDDATANAFCLPGGKMAVYTGILPITQTETGLAVVMGHEIGHAIARHGAERYSNQILTQLGLELGSVWAPEAAEAGQALAVALEVFLFMPFGREDELEADHLGVILMARAGYDPREAVDFWQRMSQMTGGEPGSDFFSTHPSHGKRIQQLQDLLPQAIAEYQTAVGAP